MQFKLPEEYRQLYDCKEVTNYIEKFFTIRKENRCRVCDSVKREHPLYKDIDDRSNNWNTIQNLVSINNENIQYELTRGASHFFVHIFKDEILNRGFENKHPDYRKLTLEEIKELWYDYAISQFIGTSYVIDIDTPWINPLTAKDGNHNFFEPDIIKQMNEATWYIGKLLDKYEFKYNCMFSGNGFYFILESFYPEEYDYKVNIFEHEEKMKLKLENIEEILRRKNNQINVHAVGQGWNRYYKSPFVFHKKQPRISIPLNKDQIGNIDVDWLKKVTFIPNIVKQNNYFKFDVRIINEIISKANWSRLW